MGLFSGRKMSSVAEAFDPNPEVIDRMPVRPYRILHADIAFFSDPECRTRIEGASLIMLMSEDPGQQHQVLECMPARKKYRAGQLVQWDLNNNLVWQNCWYRDPETGNAEMAWTQAVEFVGRVVRIAQA
jgi:hypothetical protein